LHSVPSQCERLIRSDRRIPQPEREPASEPHRR